MKWLYNVCLVLLTIMAACQTPNGIDIGTAIRDSVKSGVEAADRDRNGTLTNREITDSKNDPMFWVSIAGALLGLFGVSKAGTANVAAAKAQKEAEEAWEKAHAATNS
jgi:hypothetical protein